jgi:hypothetical protein
MMTTDVPPLGSPLPEERKFTTNAMIDMNRLRWLTAELGFIPATTDEADIERQRQHNKNANYWLGRPARCGRPSGLSGFPEGAVRLRTMSVYR